MPIRFTLLILGLALFPLGATAQDDTAVTTPEPAPEYVVEDVILDGVDASLNDFIWLKRPIVVFADSPNDPRFIQQMQFLTDRLDDLRERDVVVLTDTEKGSGSALREKLHPRGFSLVLIEKDGGVFLRKPAPWDVREITRAIDKLPLRQQEIRDRRGDS
jgi:hypothetical protein